MANIIKRVWNQNRMVQIEDLKGMTFQAEQAGHTFQISGIDDDGNTVALTGTPAGVLLRPDNTDVALTCSVSGGVVSATLPANCYDVPGRFGLTIFITSGSSKTAIYAAVGTVTRTSSGTVAPGTSQSVVDLINAINAAVNSIPASYSALLADIAPTYSDSALYSVGQYAWYDGDLKRCIVPITTAESYTAAHWMSAVLGQDVSDLKSAIEYNVPSIAENVGFVETLFQYTSSAAHASKKDILLMRIKQGEKFTINFKSTSSIFVKFYAFYSDGTSQNIYQKSNSSGEQTTGQLTAQEDILYFGAFVDDAVSNGELKFNVTKNGLITDVDEIEIRQAIDHSAIDETAEWQPKLFDKLSNSGTNLFPFINSSVSLETLNGQSSDNAIRLIDRIVIPDVWKTYYFFWSGVDFTEYPNMIVRAYAYDENDNQVLNSAILSSSYATRAITVPSSSKTLLLAIRTEDGQKLITPAFLHDKGIRLYCGLEEITTNDEFDALYDVTNLKPSVVRRMQNSTKQLVNSSEQIFADLNYGLIQNLVPQYIDDFDNVNRLDAYYQYILTSKMVPVDPSRIKMYGYWSGVDFTEYPNMAVILYFYDSNETYITSVTALTASYATREINMPSNGKFMKVSVNANNGDVILDRSFLYENGIRLYFGYKPIINDNQFDALYAVGSNTKTVLPNYWKTYIDGKIDSVKSLVESSDDTFFFITDTHNKSNQMWSPNIIREIQKRIKIEKVSCGGDFYSKGTSRRDAISLLDVWLSACDKDWMSIRGNHDNNSEGGTGEVTEKDFFTHAILPIGNRIVLMAENRAVYYFDNTLTHIRYIFLDAYNRQNDADMSAQVAWMQSKITELDSSWSVVVFAHMYWLNAQHTITVAGQQIKDGIDAVYDSAQATIIAYICGHTHEDYSITTGKGYPIISTTCDAAGIEMGGLDRTLGTPNEQAFDIFGINKTARTISTVRIGAGNDRTWNY